MAAAGGAMRSAIARPSPRPWPPRSSRDGTPRRSAAGRPRRCPARYPRLRSDSSSPRRRQPSRMRPRVGVAHRVGQEVLQHAAQQLRVAAHPGARRHVMQLQLLLPRQHAELGGQVLQHVVDAERAARSAPCRRHPAAKYPAGRPAGLPPSPARRRCCPPPRDTAACSQLLRQRMGEQVRRIQAVAPGRG